ncbi:MAG: hypothetical protein ACRD6W_06070, partial [Nitrososphaerales archaeon]
MLITGLVVTQNPGTINTFPSGYTNVANPFTGGGRSQAEGSSDYNVVSTTSNGSTVSYALSTSSTWAMLGDAVQATSSSCLSGISADGTSSNECDSSTSCSTTLSTGYSDDVIFVSVTDSFGTNDLTSLSDSAGLTWTLRQSLTGSSNYDIYTYYAIAQSSLSSDSITAQFNGGSHGSAPNDRIMAIGISGANTASPFDPNLGTAPTHTGTNAAPTVTFTTTNAKDLIIGTVADTSDTITAGASGYTAILCCTTQDSALQYKVVSATGSQTPSFTASGSIAWGEIGDAIQAAPATATPTTFQQMVTWSPASYTSYEATNLGNVRFCADDGCNTPLHAWLESCSSACSTAGSTSTSATAWVKLTSSIASGGTLTIYMVFEATAVNFDENYWGEAPNLTSTYAQYDNGATVFTAYFNGNTATTSFTVNTGLSISKVSNVSGPGSATINAIQISGTAPSHEPHFAFNQAMTNAGLITESSYAQVSGFADATAITGLVDSATASSIANGISVGAGAQGDYFYQMYDSGGTVSAFDNTLGTAVTSETWLYGSTTYSGTTAISWSAYIAPQLYSSTGGQTGTWANNPLSGVAGSIYLGGIGGSAAVQTYYNWERARAYPPNGLMPAVSAGTLTSGTGSPTTVTDTLGDSFALGVSQSVFSGSTAYESEIWYATASSSGSNTITATFTAAVSGSVSLYEVTGYSTSGVLSSSGSSSAGSTSASVGSFTPNSNSFVVGNVETGSSSTRYTVGAGYTTVAAGGGGCDASDASQGCNEYETGLGAATTTPFTLSASTPWVEAAMSLTPLAANTYYS